MDKFLDWLVVNPNLATFILVILGLLLFIIVLIYLLAFMQGRKISFWPPSIGERTELISKVKEESLRPQLPDGTPLSGKVEPLDKKYGLVRFYNMQDQDEQSKRNSDTKELILQGNMFYLLAFSAASYIDPGIKRHWDFLRSKLDNGAPMQVLLMDPFHKEKRYRDKLNSISTSFDPKFRFDLLVNLYNRYPSASIKVVTQNIYCINFFSEKEMIYDPYHLGKISDRLENNFFALRIANSEDPNNYYKVLKRHFEHLWSISEDFENFTKRQHANLVIPYKKVDVKARTTK